MWLVRIALSRPYTFVVLALILMIIGTLTIIRMAKDVFPSIDIPVVSVVWSYNGMPPDDMTNRITSVFERAVTSTVTNIEHIESHTLNGVNVVKLFFQKDVTVAVALAEVTAISQTILKQLPPGATPPLILSYDASTVPVMQLVLSSNTLSEQKLNDLSNNYIRTQLATVQGAALPFAYGGKIRQVQVDLNTDHMQAYGVSALNINDAVTAQSIIIPAGTAKIAQYEYLVKLNSVPVDMPEFNMVPVKAANNDILYLRDVAHVRDGFAPQTNIVRVNGLRAVMMSVEKTGHASGLDIINRIKDLLPIIQESLPSSLHLSIFGDQSIFIKSAIRGVIVEAISAGLLTALMILLFLGSFRSTAIIVLAIPLSMLASIALLAALGHTINIMTMGGLALAVGILVDDATVAIENINYNLEQGKRVQQAILEGAQQIAIPALVSTLCICIVFIPVFFLSGVAKFLFIPMAEAVIFAMLTSYLISRTLVPTMAAYLLRTHQENLAYAQTHRTFGVRFHEWFEEKFQTLQQHYQTLLERTLTNTPRFIGIFYLLVLLSLLLLWPWLGSNFFPNVDAGEIKLHFSAPSGTRVEETARTAAEINQIIKRYIPPKEIHSIVDNIGLPVSGINLSYSNSATNGPQDADIMISLNTHHHPIADYMRTLRKQLQRQFPGITFAFLPADIVNQILNFGLPSVIDIQVMGLQQKANREYAMLLLNHIKHIPGIVDARIRQADNYPTLTINADRSRAKELGFTQADIAANLLLALSGSFQTTPNFWVDPNNGVSYPVVTQAPQYSMDSLQTLLNIPISNRELSTMPQILAAMATFERTGSPVVVSHYNVQPVTDIYAGIQDRDLGAVAQDLKRILAQTKNEIPKGSQVLLRGQIATQQQAFRELYIGLVFSILLIYLVIVINFQSWTDPFIIITALPAALAGIAWMLFITHTTLSVPALTGAIMCMGVATANSILVVSFARQHMSEGHDPLSSALEAGKTRLRPVLMTALAMIIGMCPMALGLGEGSEQNAPLGRAVVGGLSFATLATLFLVPAVFCLIHTKRRQKEKKA